MFILIFLGFIVVSLLFVHVCRLLSKISLIDISMQIMQISQSLLSFPFYILFTVSIMKQTGMIHNVIVTKDTGTILVSQYLLY